MHAQRILIAAALACGAAALTADPLLTALSGGAALFWPEPRKPRGDTGEKPQCMSF